MRLHGTKGDTHHDERLRHYARADREAGANVLPCAVAVYDSG
jgi:hypothetical protein